MFRTIICFISFLIPSILFGQIGYGSQPRSYNFKPARQNLELIGNTICIRQFENDLANAQRYFNHCSENTASCNIQFAELDHSSWLSYAVSFSYKGSGYSVLVLKNETYYYFHYIPNRILKQWESSSSPGRFYHSHIREQYNLSSCVKYEP